MTVNGKINSTSDFTTRGLGELRMWLEPWFIPRIHRSGGGASSLVIQDEGVALPVEPILNFIGASVVAADDPTHTRTNVTITATTTRKLVATWAGAVPPSLGNGIVWRVPYQDDGSSWAFTLKRAFLRVETPNAAGYPTTVRVEKAPGGDVVFAPSTIVTLSVTTPSDYEVENTGLSTVVNSGDLLRIVFTAVGADGSNYCVELVGTT